MGEDSKPLNRWSTFKDSFSGSSRFVHACISDPFQPSRTIPSENEIMKVVESHLLKVEHSLLGIYKNQVELLEECIRLRLSSSEDDGTRSRIKALNINRIKAFDEWKEARKVFLRLSCLDSESELKEHATALANSGGLIGSVHDNILGKKLPLLLGCFYLDEASVHEVQCLGVEPVNPDTNEWMVLGCTVLDPLTGRIESAKLGGRMRDPRSGEIVPINGVLRDETVNMVMPFSNLNGHRIAQPEHAFIHGLQAPEVLASLLSRIRTSETDLEKLMSAVHNESTSKTDMVPSVYNLAQHAISRTIPTGIISGFPATNSNESVGVSLKQHVIPTDANDSPRQHETTRMVQSSLIANPVNITLNNSVVGAPHDDSASKIAGSGSRRNTSVDGSGKHQMDLEKDLENFLLHLFPGGGNNDVQGIFHKIIDNIRVNLKEFQNKIANKSKTLDTKHYELIEKVKCSDLDVGHKKQLIAEMKRQKTLMDQIMAQEHSRQTSAFQRALFESAERRLRRFEKLQNQYNELHASAESRNVSASDHAAHRMQIDMSNALEDNVNQLLTTAAEQRLEEISKEQEEVLEAFAGCAGAVNSIEMEDKILGQYEEDVDKIEARIRHTTAETISQLSADSETELSRKLARLKIAAERALAKQRWSKLRAIVKTGFITASSRTLLTSRSVILARHEEQLNQLNSSLDEQSRVEIMAMLNAHEIQTGKLVSDAEVRLAENLKAVNDDKQRALLLDSHAADMDILRKRIMIDHQAQMQSLEMKLADRKKRKVEEWQRQAQRELDIATPENKVEFDLQSHLVQVIADQEAQRARLIGALVQQDRLEKEELANSLDIRAERQIFESEVEFLTSLNTVENDDERSKLIAAHEKDCEVLRKRLELDKNRQLEELQSMLEKRRRRKLDEEQENMHQQQCALLISPGKSQEFEKLCSEIEALTRQEIQKSLLVSALNDASKADRQELVHGLCMSRDLALAQAEVRFVENLDEVDSNSRALLIKSHEEEMELMKKKFELDKQRRLEELDHKLSERRKHKINNEQANLHQREIALLRNPGNSQESDVLGIKIEAMLQHEVEAAQLSGAVIEHGIADLKILIGHQSAQQEAVLAAANAQFLEDVRKADDSERESLLKMHELNLAKLRAQGAFAQSKAEDELQQRIADRKSKKDAALREKQAKCMQLLDKGTDKVSLMKELDAARSENTIEIEFEKKTASAMFNILSESESEVKLLREDFKQKAEQVILNAESKFAHELTLLQDAASDIDKERRNKLLQVDFDC